MKTTNKQEMTANELVNVKDIKGSFLYTKDGYVFGYLQIYPYNLDLVSMEERRAKTNAQSMSFDGDRKDFVYQTFPREIDLDRYKDHLKRQYQSEIESVGRRRLLAEMLLEAIALSSSGENYEHQHYIKLWKKVGSQAGDAEGELKERLEEFRERYGMIGIHAEILGYEQIIKLCNLFGNSGQISNEIVDDNPYYTPLAQIRGVSK